LRKENVSESKPSFTYLIADNDGLQSWFVLQSQVIMAF